MRVLRGFTFILAKIATWQCTLQQKFEMKEEEELRAQSHPFNVCQEDRQLCHGLVLSCIKTGVCSLLFPSCVWGCVWMCFGAVHDHSFAPCSLLRSGLLLDSNLQEI